MKARIGLALGAALMAVAAPAHAEDNWIVRLRAISIAPTGSNGPVLPSFPTGSTSVDHSYVPELDITYMATKHIGAELILGTAEHHIAGEGALGGLGRLAHSWVLPPTLTLQYHFLPDGHVRPYVGAGVNYTIFYSEGANSALDNAIGHTRVGLSDSVGYALQGGVDIDVTKRVFVNFDLKYLDIKTTAHLTTGSLVNRERVHLDPLVPGIGIGMRF